MHDPAQGVFLENPPLEDDIQYQDLYEIQNPGAENDAQYAFYGLGNSLSRRIGKLRSDNLSRNPCVKFVAESDNKD